MSEFPLFINGKECAERLGVEPGSWPAVRRRWEERGFPKPNAETNKYLWPKVKAWVFQDNELHASVEGAEDGPEDWKA